MRPEPAPARLLDDADPLPGRRQAAVWRVPLSGRVLAEKDELANEVPVALEYNGISHATVLATPCSLEDFAYGFSFTEGVVRSASDIYDIDIHSQDSGVVVQLTIASACLNQLKLRRRNLAGRTGCGLCGLESLDEVQRELPAVPPRAPYVNAQAILQAARELKQSQPLHLETGATHAAAWADATGAIQQVREDVGRHNALDKLIGHLMRTGSKTNNGFAVISSRASFEMVQKAAAASIGVLAAVSAPTSYAAQLADELNILLTGFTRNDSFTVYAHPEHLKDLSL